LHEGHWQLSALAGVRLTDVARLPYLMFRRDGGAFQMRGYAGCNQVRAPYVTQGQQLLIGNMATTKMACFGEQGQLEGALLQVLADTSAFDISGHTLTLLADDEALARFTFRRETPSQ
jgi:heat shock protein HslJ